MTPSQLDKTKAAIEALVTLILSEMTEEERQSDEARLLYGAKGIYDVIDWMRYRNTRENG